MRVVPFLLAVAGFIVADTAHAGCFTEKLIENDSAYREYEWTNNCASRAAVTTRRRYKKDNGAQMVDTNRWIISACSTFATQMAQGDYEDNELEVDQSEICIPKGAERPPGFQDSGKNAGSQSAPTKSGGAPANSNSSTPGNSGADYQAARRVEERMQFETAEKIDTVDVWRKFLGQFPDGVNAEWAKKRIKELSDKSENNRSSSEPKPFFGTVRLAFQINTVVQARVGSSTSSRSSAATRSVEVGIGADRGTYSEGSARWDCGFNSPISTSRTDSTQYGPANLTWDCSISKTGDRYNIQMTHNGQLNLAAGQRTTERQRASVEFSLTKDGCSSGSYLFEGHRESSGWVVPAANQATDTRSVSVSSNCSVN